MWLWLGSSWANAYAHGIDECEGLDWLWVVPTGISYVHAACALHCASNSFVLNRWIRIPPVHKNGKYIRDYCYCFACTNEYIILLQAWDLYYHVFRRIDKQLPSLTSLDLQARNGYIRFHWWFDSFIYFMWCMSLVSLHYQMQSVSPELLNCRNLELAVPGTYRAGKVGFMCFYSSSPQLSFYSFIYFIVIFFLLRLKLASSELLRITGGDNFYICTPACCHYV